MLNTFKHHYFFILSISIIIGLFIVSIHNGFFWDTVQLGSRHANYYFDTNFSNIFLPNDIDSGHIPSFGMYLALVWKIFGRTLMLSHLAMIPFIVGIMFQTKTLIEHYFKKEQIGLVFFLVLLDPTLLTQMTLISPDVPLMFFFILAWNSIIKNKKYILSASIFFLFLISMRGMMVAFCLLIVDVFYHLNFKNSVKIKFQFLLKRSTIYLPALLLFISFSIYHYIEKGWIGFHSDSPWAESFENVSFYGFVRNLGILGWRLIDFGRIGIWMVGFVLFIKFKNKIFINKQTRSLFLICICFILILPSNMVWAKNLLGHRYLMPIFFIFSLLIAKVLFSTLINVKLRNALIIFWTVSLISGNFWVYPHKVSQGWDATLAHLPYYNLRLKAIDYLDKENIKINTVHSFFPNTPPIDFIDLNKDYRHFAHYSTNAKYVLYSNVYNISDDAYVSLMNDYVIIKEFNSTTVFVRIYKKVSTEQFSIP